MILKYHTNMKCVHLQLCAYRTIRQSASLTAKLPFCMFAGTIMYKYNWHMVRTTVTHITQSFVTSVSNVAWRYTSHVHLSPLTLISAANISITVVIIIIRVITRNIQYTHIRQYISGIKKMKRNYIAMLYKDAVKTWKKLVYLEWLQ